MRKEGNSNEMIKTHSKSLKVKNDRNNEFFKKSRKDALINIKIMFFFLLFN